jgi:hypothetical protein
MSHIQMPGDEERELFWGRVLFGIFIITDLLAAVIIFIGMILPRILYPN